MCARFLEEIHSHYIPGLDGKKSVAREANRVWPVSLPEETDLFVANKIIDQLRDLLHRKLMEVDGKIQTFYDQMKHGKRTSHGELSSSRSSSRSRVEEEEEEFEGMKSDVSELVGGPGLGKNQA